MLDKEKGTWYDYDSSGRVSETDGCGVWYDEKNRLYSRDVTTPFGKIATYVDYADGQYPDNPDRVKGSRSGGYTENYSYDSLSRIDGIDVELASTASSPTKTCSLKREITYNDSDAEEGNKKYASELVKSISVRDGNKGEFAAALSAYTLDYDGDGNITKHTTQVTYESSGLFIPATTESFGLMPPATSDYTILQTKTTSATYEYDKLNRLTRENNERLGKTWTYSYDAGGNITERKEYAYTTAEQLDNETATATKEYVYRTSGWKDQLLSYDGESIVYDASGNPTTYRGATLGFEAGRRLKSYKKAGDANAYEFTFDYRGVRNSKKTKDADGHDKTWSFYYDEDGKLWGETKSEKVLQGNFGIQLWTDKITKIGFFHLNSGLAGFTLSRQTGIADAVKADYIYRKNALGDIDGIFDTDMNLIGEYVYDAWGNCTIEAAGANNIEIMEINPFRYRGYYWDKELNLYYLQTRYYDPQTGRFINADGIEYALEQYKNINALNLYSYCNNNPIMGIDPEGTINWKKIFNIIGVFAIMAAAVVVAVGALVTGGLVGAVVGGAATGALFAMSKNVHEQVQTNGFENFKWGSFLKDMAVGATVGAVTGAVSHVAMGIGASVGSQLGLSFSKHAIRGVTMGSIVSRDILVGAGSFLGQAGANLVAQVASGFATNYFMNENNDFDEIMNNGIFDAIKDLLLDLFLK